MRLWKRLCRRVSWCRWLAGRQVSPSAAADKIFAAPEFRLLSTASKDRAYFEQLASLRLNRAFLQEMNERLNQLLVEFGRLNINDPLLDRRVIYLQGQIAACNWVLTDLIHKRATPGALSPPAKEASGQRHKQVTSIASG